MNRRSRSTLGSPIDRASRSARIFQAPPARPANRKRRHPTSFARGESLGLRSRQSRSWRISRLLARASPRAGGRKGGAVDVKRIRFDFGSGGCVRGRDDTVGRANLKQPIGTTEPNLRLPTLNGGVRPATTQNWGALSRDQRLAVRRGIVSSGFSAGLLQAICRVIRTRVISPNRPPSGHRNCSGLCAFVCRSDAGKGQPMGLLGHSDVRYCE